MQITVTFLLHCMCRVVMRWTAPAPARRYNFAIARNDLPDDLAYQIVKAVHEKHTTFKDTLPENVVKNTILPFHPGAIRCYREIGMSILDSLVPTN